MKKLREMNKSLIVAIVAFSAVFTSCEKKAPELIGTGELVFTTTLHDGNEIVIGKKSAEQGNEGIEVLVKTVEVKTENEQGDKTENSFDILDEEGNVIDSHSISPIPLGVTSITANTITPEGNSKHELNYIADINDITELVNKAPYIIYEGSANVEIKKDEVAHAVLDMTTNNGKMVVSFSPEKDGLLDNYRIQIKQGDEELEMTNETGRNNVYFYWSDKTATDGAAAKFTVNWLDKDNKIVYTKELNDFKIKKGVSTYYKVLVSDSNIIEKPAQELVLSFVFKPVVNEEVDINI